MNIKKYVRNCAALILGFLPMFSSTAFAATVSNVEYIDANGNKQTCASAPVVENGTITWSAGWYVVDSDVTIAERITVSGEVHLILADGYTLTAEKGINVSDGNSLTIYGQSGDTGELEAIGTGNDASIGGNGGANGGTDDDGYGIAGGPGTKSGVITINGGTITAQGSIGGGWPWRQRRIQR